MILILISVLLVYVKAQSQIISLILGNNTFTNVGVDIDDCQNHTHACQIACIDGLHPPYGYTCQKPDNETLPIDPSTISLFNLAKSAGSTLGLQIETINDAEIDYSKGTVKYVFGLSESIGVLGPLVSSAAPALADSIKDQTGVYINPERITITASGKEISFAMQFPTESITVYWTSVTNGNSENLRKTIFQIVNLNYSLIADQVLEFNGYFANNYSVYVMFFEDIGQQEGKDTQYITRACGFAKGLFYPINETAIESSGFNLDYSTLGSTDPNCLHMPTPNPNPIPQFLVGSPNGISRVVFCWIVYLIVLLFL